MLERAAARSQGSKDGVTEGVAKVPDQPPPPLPSEAQLEAVENEDFAPQRFKSRRTVKVLIVAWFHRNSCYVQPVTASGLVLLGFIQRVSAVCKYT